MDIHDILKKSETMGDYTKEEISYMLSLPSESPESYLIMAEANRISKDLTGNRAEVHAQFALNLAPCKCNCLFCSFADVNNIFDQSTDLSVDEAVRNAKQFEKDGANAVYVMTTAYYPFARYIEIGREIRKSLKHDTMLIANVGDRSLKEALQLKEAGFQGVYHAIRMREGVDTDLKPEKRKESIRNFTEAGLGVGTCVEPVGPEHSNDELAEMILYTASFNPAYSGAARRISIPGGKMEALGMISELRMSQIVAVTRLAMPRTTRGNCTHEPCTLGAMAGANLFWAEVGANPRDIKENTEDGRGGTVSHCSKLFHESGWEVMQGQSRYY